MKKNVLPADFRSELDDDRKRRFVLVRPQKISMHVAAETHFRRLDGQVRVWWIIADEARIRHDVPVLDFDDPAGGRNGHVRLFDDV